ncbi:lantibiotic dehydratase (plasmid) [Streptomyces goshikiensis]|uniref:lantibiotic dehydratase n=1 Tax=Streptomyces goshikiensis TaxID=1942 RepID=UPI002F90C056|nr:lantibiotic dehydratase [Streptomyces goshikiensis]
MNLYTPAGYFLLRTPTLPFTPYAQALDGTGAAGRDRIREVAGQPLVRQALRVASDSLAEQLRKDARDDRTDASLLRYVSRMSSRPTPYGLFAQVAAGEFGPRTSLTRTGARPAATRTRADMGWLEQLVQQIEDDRDVRPGLTVVLNPLLQRSHDRLTLPVSHSLRPTDQRVSSVRITRAVETVLDRAATRPTWAELTARAARDFPAVPAARIDALLDRLWDLRMLTSDLRPPMTHPLPETAVLDRLAGLAGAERYRGALGRTRDLAARADAAPPEHAERLLAELQTYQRTLVPGHTESPLQLDARAALATDTTVTTGTPAAAATTDTAAATLSAAVADAAADAADVLLRLGHHTRDTALAAYHEHFLDRYGSGAEIPVLELLNPETGLGAPDGYHFPARELPLELGPRPRPATGRSALTALAAAALHQGATEVELTDAFLAGLPSANGGGAGPRPRPGLDVLGQLMAESRQDLDTGRWRFVLTTGAVRDGGRIGARFFDLLGEDFGRRMKRYAEAEEARCPGVLFAELNYRPLHSRGGNIAIHPSVRSHEICVNTEPTAGVGQIGLDDVLVGATSERLYLRSAAHDQELKVTQSHLFNWSTAPNVCRFLLEVSQDGWAALAEFEWGDLLEAADFLPRVTRGRVVLKPARWRFGPGAPGFPAGLASGTPEAERFFEIFQKWRRDWHVPRWVNLAMLDNRLLLDLDSSVCVAEIQRELRSTAPHKGGNLIMEEALFDPLRPQWLRDGAGRSYTAEIAVPLLARNTATGAAVPVAPATAIAAGRTAARRPALAKHQLPGGDWSHLKLYAAASRHEDLLTGEVPRLVHGLREEGLIDRWFFIRYADPHPHLRIRVRRRPGAAPHAAMNRLVDWAGDLVGHGPARDAALISYDRETERYGGPVALEALEAVFEAGSDMTTTVLALVRDRPGMDLDVVGALALHRLYEAWGHQDGAPADTAPHHTVEARDREAFRAVRTTLCDLVAPWDARPDARARQWAPDLDRLLAIQDQAVRQAGDLVRRLARAGELTGTEQDVLGSLAHMQSNRLLGIDRTRELRSHSFRALALRAVRGRP